ncbi:MAG: LON peptidase substrate-binding domain-containing protein [Acidobacteria bacterium]|nr:LON peptidase substrate-binding domain-containing protein [Acidobacteriota bacterium]
MNVRKPACALALVALLGLPAVAGAQNPPRDAAADAAKLPSVIPLFPLPEAVLFPGVARPLFIFEPRYREMVADALTGDRIIGMVLLRPGFEKDYEGRPPIYEIGCAGEIEEYEQLPDGRYTIVLRGLTKFRVVGEDQRRVYRLARVEVMPEVPTEEELAPLSALRQRLSDLLLAVLPPNIDPPGPWLTTGVRS